MSVVGIDLGTTNTVIACVKNGRVSVIADEQGRRLLPSVVSFHPNGDVLVGHAAKARRAVDAKNTIASVKRLLGRTWNSPELEKARKRFAFEMKEGPGQGPLVVARGKEYTLPEISAFVLKRAREMAETALGERVERAVITVPAHFNELQRAATKVAGRVAGLEVLRILNEPTAAALAYGLGKGTRERIAVYDFGGGTFDATLLDLNGNVFEVLATAGDPFLGGDDIDDAMADRMCEAFLVQHRFDPRTDPQSLERLRQAAEQLKIALTQQDQSQAHLREIAFGVGGVHLDLVFGMSRAELEKMAEPLIERTFKVTQDALTLARLAPSEFDRTILVGGTSRMPLVRRRVEAFFGAAPLDKMNPDEVVAIGAAIQAAALTDASRRRSIPAAPTAFATPRKSAPSFDDLPPVNPRASRPELTPRASKVDANPRASKPEISPRASRPEITPRASQPEEDQETQAMRRDDVPASSRRAPPSSSAPMTARGVAPPGPDARISAIPTPTTRNNTGPTTERISKPPDTPSRPFGTIDEPSSFQESGTGAPPQPPRTPTPPAYTSPFVVPTTGSAPPPPPPNYMSQPPRPPVFTPTMPPPVLIDVTPRALVVETVGGYCDTVIPRNAQIPCERTRVFSTAHDGQQVVVVRVAQGEEPGFRTNTYLGEVELTGIRPAPRGEASVSVTFELDADGTLNVRASDAATGRQASAKLRLEGIAGEADIATMRQRMEQAGTVRAI
jgi:molecular chaperone DnaK